METSNKFFFSLLYSVPNDDYCSANHSRDSAKRCTLDYDLTYLAYLYADIDMKGRNDKQFHPCQ